MQAQESDLRYKLKQASRAKKGPAFINLARFSLLHFWERVAPCGFFHVYSSTSWSLPHPSFIRWRQHSHREWFFSFIRFHQGAWQPIFIFHPLHYFLGMEVSRSTSGLRLTQTKYTLEFWSRLYPALRYAYISRCQAIRPYSYKRQAALTTDALPRAFLLGRNLLSWSAKKAAPF